ncbi:metal-dependent hydrolase [Streptomyces sp. SID3343]|uniref:metal-dependent hydrolase n=1 Tax=Streptomyces sp. SID3343 TaxID=2690260 RepID=UPI00136928AC|nr:metal-dependent hydrolase [Streptomyces sp. SID3343]MYV98827.1 metal-dependent hydrolase [Streptomyces sp. SID3343]
MLGHSHAVSGALAFAAAGPTLPQQLWHNHLSASEIVIGTFLTAGAALLPDLDHHNGTIANFLGPVSKAVCGFVAKVSGGHRHATHSIAFVVLAGLLTFAGVQRLGRPFTLSVVFLLLALALRALNICPPGKGLASWITIVALAGGGTAVVDHWMPSAPDWLPMVIVLGCVAHLLGDFLTKQGIPLLWPLGTRFEVALVSRTGNRVETLVLVPVMMIATIALLWFTTFA